MDLDMEEFAIVAAVSLLHMYQLGKWVVSLELWKNSDMRVVQQVVRFKMSLVFSGFIS